MEPYSLTTASAANVSKLNPLHGLLSCGTDVGTVECFDPRSREQVGVLDVAKGIPVELYEGELQEHVLLISIFLFCPFDTFSICSIL